MGQIDDLCLLLQVGKIRMVTDQGVIREDAFYNYVTGWYNVDNMMYYVSQVRSRLGDMEKDHVIKRFTEMWDVMGTVCEQKSRSY